MFWLILLSIVLVNAQYEVPPAKIEVLSPKGFRVSIPDEEGIKLFAFHGKLNEELNGREGGTFSRDVTKAKNGRWTFYDRDTKLNVGDTLYYWTYVDYFDGKNKLGYTRDDEQFVVTELITEDKSNNANQKPTACSTTETSSNSGKFCAGSILLDEDFLSNSLTDKFWTIQQKYADEPDYEFVMYMNLPETLQVTNGMLKIKPMLSEKHFGTGFVTSFKGYDFHNNCTGISGSAECRRSYDRVYYLPPVISSQITSKEKFSFKYGKVEIRAKLPKGDWIYPELYLDPLHETYGSKYESGQIRIAFIGGNSDLNQILKGGAVLGNSVAARNSEIKSTTNQMKSWSDDFHKFAIVWKPDSITLSVDDRVYGSIYPPPEGFSKLVNEPQSQRWKSGTRIAPFDQEMYLTIGVGVGGFNFDNRDDGSKPWRNGDRLSVNKFYNASNHWLSTWDENSAMEVDYVKVWAV